MEPLQFYKQRIETLQAELKQLQRKKSSFAWLRLGAVLAIFLAFYLLYAYGIIYVVFATMILLFVFIRMIFLDLNNATKIDHLKTLISINENEINYLSGNYYNHPDGAAHNEKEHAYANDLDIFGRASLFQFINRTTSEPGSNTLADYLKRPAPIDDIEQRQEAVKELSGKIKWIQDLRSIGEKDTITISTKERLEAWIKDPPVFSQFKPWSWLRYLLPAIILSIIMLFIFDKVSFTFLLFSLLVFLIISYQLNKYIAPVHEKLSRIAKELNTLTASISAIEKQNFECLLLKKLQSTFLKNNKNASQEIYTVKKIMDKLDTRYNLVLAVTLNPLLLWNLQQVLDLEKWKTGKQHHIDKWFRTLGEFEALWSFGTLDFNQPSWVFPIVIPGYFSIKGKEIGHPLIPESKRVNNFINISDAAQLMLVTGSNMAGKSTYLRSIGINVVLAMAGAPVCASEFKVSHVQVISSMRISDNLEESTSTFYAELKKLKSIIEKVNQGDKVFILLDEILRGTNSLDRHTGSKALIKQLIKNKAAAIIATHDLELADLKNEFPENILNFHFDVQVSKEELYFDYLLKAGICTSLNASILMKKIGIEL